MSTATAGRIRVKAVHIGHDAWGAAKYRVLVQDAADDDRVVFVSEALRLPWVDDQRALRDAVGFLAYYLDEYMLDGVEPDAGSGVTLAELQGLAAYATDLEELSADLDA